MRGAAAFAIVGSLLAAPALAHDDQHLSDWIGNGQYRNPVTGEHCCGFYDCAPLPEGSVIFDGSQGQRGVWIIIPTKEKVPDAEALPSRDHRYWRCHRPDGKLRCFFRPQGGV